MTSSSLSFVSSSTISQNPAVASAERRKRTRQDETPEKNAKQKISSADPSLEQTPTIAALSSQALSSLASSLSSSSSSHLSSSIDREIVDPSAAAPRPRLSSPIAMAKLISPALSGDQPSSDSSRAPSVSVQTSEKPASSKANDRLSPLSWDPFFSLVEGSTKPFSILEMVAKVDKSYFEKFPKKFSDQAVQKTIERSDIFPAVLSSLILGYIEDNQLPKEDLPGVIATVNNDLEQFQAKAKPAIGPEVEALSGKVREMQRKNRGVFYPEWSDPQARDALLTVKCAMSLLETEPTLADAVSFLGWNLEQHGMLNSEKVHPIIQAFPSQFEADKHQWDLKSLDLITKGAPIASNSVSFQELDTEKSPVRGGKPTEYPKEAISYSAQILNKVLSLWNAIHGEPTRVDYTTLHQNIYSLSLINPRTFHIRWTPMSDIQGLSKRFLLNLGMRIREEFPALAFNIEQLSQHWPERDVPKHPIMETNSSVELLQLLKKDIQTYKQTLESDFQSKKQKEELARESEKIKQQTFSREQNKRLNLNFC